MSFVDQFDAQQVLPTIESGQRGDGLPTRVTFAQQFDNQQVGDVPQVEELAPTTFTQQFVSRRRPKTQAEIEQGIRDDEFINSGGPLRVIGDTVAGIGRDLKSGVDIIGASAAEFGTEIAQFGLDTYDYLNNLYGGRSTAGERFRRSVTNPVREHAAQTVRESNLPGIIKHPLSVPLREAGDLPALITGFTGEGAAMSAEFGGKLLDFFVDTLNPGHHITQMMRKNLEDEIAAGNIDPESLDETQKKLLSYRSSVGAGDFIKKYTGFLHEGAARVSERSNAAQLTKDLTQAAAHLITEMPWLKGTGKIGSMINKRFGTSIGLAMLGGLHGLAEKDLKQALVGATTGAVFGIVDKAGMGVRNKLLRTGALSLGFSTAGQMASILMGMGYDPRAAVKDAVMGGYFGYTGQYRPSGFTKSVAEQLRVMQKGRMKEPWRDAIKRQLPEAKEIERVKGITKQQEKLTTELDRLLRYDNELAKLGETLRSSAPKKKIEKAKGEVDRTIEAIRRLLSSDSLDNSPEQAAYLKKVLQKEGPFGVDGVPLPPHQEAQFRELSALKKQSATIAAAKNREVDHFGSTNEVNPITAREREAWLNGPGGARQYETAVREYGDVFGTYRAGKYPVIDGKPMTARQRERFDSERIERDVLLERWKKTLESEKNAIHMREARAGTEWSEAGEKLRKEQLRKAGETSEEMLNIIAGKGGIEDSYGRIENFGQALLEFFNNKSERAAIEVDRKMNNYLTEVDALKLDGEGHRGLLRGFGRKSQLRPNRGKNYEEAMYALHWAREMPTMSAEGIAGLHKLGKKLGFKDLVGTAEKINNPPVGPGGHKYVVLKGIRDKLATDLSWWQAQRIASGASGDITDYLPRDYIIPGGTKNDHDLARKWDANTLAKNLGDGKLELKFPNAVHAVNNYAHGQNKIIETRRLQENLSSLTKVNEDGISVPMVSDGNKQAIIGTREQIKARDAATGSNQLELIEAKIAAGSEKYKAISRDKDVLYTSHEKGHVAAKALSSADHKGVMMRGDPEMMKYVNKSVFKPAKRTEFGKFFDRQNNAMKHLLLVASLFHKKAIWSSKLLGSLHSKNPVRTGLAAAAEGDYMVRLLARQGLTYGVGSPEALQAQDLRPKTRAGEYFKKWRIGTEDSLFNKTQTGLKISAALSEMRMLMRENPNLQPSVLAKHAASVYNADFGGLNYERMGISPTALKWARRGLLSTDWTLSNLLTVTKAAPFGRALNNWKPGMKNGRPAFVERDSSGMGLFPAEVKLEQKVYRDLWTRVAIRGALTTVFANMIFNGFDVDEIWENYGKTLKGGKILNLAKVDLTNFAKLLGDKSGRRKYWNLFGQFMDPAEWAENFAHDPARPLKNKASLAARGALDLVTAKDWMGRAFNEPGEVLKTGELSSFEAKSGLPPSKYPTFLMAQLRATLPIWAQTALKLGLEDKASAFTEIAKLGAIEVNDLWPRGGSRGKRIERSSRSSFGL